MKLQHIGRRSMNMAVAAAILLVVGTVEARAQSRDAIRTRGEAALQQMTPTELERRIREMGMTREEASRRAAEYGIALEDYLGRASTMPDTAVLGGIGSVAGQSVPSAPSSPAIATSGEATLEISIPGISDRVGAKGLLPFGYELFRYASSTFQPITAVATPKSYVLGPGDEISMIMWGETKLSLTLQVNREGNVIVPEVGPIVAHGSSIEEFRTRLLRRLSSVYAGLQSGGTGATSFLDVSLSRLRTVQVFVLGEVERPGGYSVSSMGTILHALYSAGGPSVTGSFRSVELVRSGKRVAKLDLYDYLLRGDRSKDTRLEDGDVVFVPVAGRRVGISGFVTRPRIYELSDMETLGLAIRNAGGLRFEADVRRVHVERLIPFPERSKFDRNILDIEYTFDTPDQLLSSPARLEDGDIIHVRRVREMPQNRVRIWGHVSNPGPYELTEGMRVRDLILRADSLVRGAFVVRGTLSRELPNLRREILSFNVLRALDEAAEDNLLLRNEDEVTLYADTTFNPRYDVWLLGAVHAPGKYRRHERMTVGDLIVSGGGLTASADRAHVEISKVETTSIGVYVTANKLSLPEDYWESKGDAATLLTDFDRVFVPANPQIGEQRPVYITGRVKYPGTYSLRRFDERLSELVERAGGAIEGAYFPGSRLTRRYRDAGLIPVDFEEALAEPTSVDNIALLEGDSIHIALRDNVIYVRGEVYTPAAVLYQAGRSLDYYLNQAGGVRKTAEESGITVTLPSGKKWEPRWWIIPDPEILPGSVVVVPALPPEREDRTLPVLRDTATILASIAAIAVAVLTATK